ncbi:BolA family transcriptional regulator [Pseudorhodobacter sp.]|uniref:BolA family protein n=1 Tax=Pseudorhodobacter sp. TaxID=1934400 RepID=UPI0026479CAD|nr:BolA family protein [Pseudorhodobacter sp.]MDN5786977.1 BolA family transcriptional regulator [Pseudorhodobacter sp.]
MTVAEEIAAKLTGAFSPDRLEVVNDSNRHLGHAGDDGTGQTHFNVLIRAKALARLSRLARHRTIHAALGPDLIARIHALAIDAG